MASVGQLAAGIAHEINNPIGFVISNIQTFSDYFQVMKRLFSGVDQLANEITDAKHSYPQLEVLLAEMEKEDLEFILEDTSTIIDENINGLDRVKKIVSNLKTFSRADSGDKECFDIHQCLEQSIQIVWNELKYKIELEKDYGETPKLYGNSAQLGQVFMNFLVNASQAIEKSGTIWIRTFVEDAYLIVEIEDNGKGIEESIKDKLFDPFFTTKPVGLGTGLGLSISHGIIDSHQGNITVESELGKGSCFRVALPLNGGAEESEH